MICAKTVLPGLARTFVQIRSENVAKRIFLPCKIAKNRRRPTLTRQGTRGAGGDRKILNTYLNTTNKNALEKIINIYQVYSKNKMVSINAAQRKYIQITLCNTIPKTVFYPCQLYLINNSRSSNMAMVGENENFLSL